VRVRACVRVCVRARVCSCVCARARACACVCARATVSLVAGTKLCTANVDFSFVSTRNLFIFVSILFCKLLNLYNCDTAASPYVHFTVLLRNILQWITILCLVCVACTNLWGHVTLYLRELRSCRGGYDVFWGCLCVRIEGPRETQQATSECRTLVGQTLYRASHRKFNVWEHTW
jgi:hypothetical protein